jgi:hypothetical protein
MYSFVLVVDEGPEIVYEDTGNIKIRHIRYNLDLIIHFA